MQKDTSVTLGAHCQKFISQQVAKELSLLQRALIEGEESGTANYSLNGLIEEIEGL